MTTPVIVALVIQLVVALYHYFTGEYDKATFWVAAHIANFLWLNMYFN